jgi:hypothetical protein
MGDNFVIRIVDRDTNEWLESSELISKEFINKIISHGDTLLSSLVKEKIDVEINLHVWLLDGPSINYNREPDLFLDYFSSVLNIIKENNDKLPEFYWIRPKIEGQLSKGRSNRFYPVLIENEEWHFEGDWGYCRAKSNKGHTIDILSQNESIFKGIYVGRTKTLKGKKIEITIEEQSFLDRFEYEIIKCIEICKKAKSNNHLVLAEIS